MTLIGAAAFGSLALAAAGRRRAVPAAAGALALGLALAAVQVLPAAAEVARSARASEMRPEHGALFWSVRPSRVLTLLEPRLTGDAAQGPHWGAATFDASGPYFDDLALGVLPLLFAAAAWRDRRGRAALLVAGGAAVLSFGRFLPGYGAVARVLVLRALPGEVVAPRDVRAGGGCGCRGGRGLLRERGGSGEGEKSFASDGDGDGSSSAARSSAWRSARKIFLERCCGGWGWARATRLARRWQVFCECHC